VFSPTMRCAPPFPKVRIRPGVRPWILRGMPRYGFGCGFNPSPIIGINLRRAAKTLDLSKGSHIQNHTGGCVHLEVLLVSLRGRPIHGVASNIFSTVVVRCCPPAVINWPRSFLLKAGHRTDLSQTPVAILAQALGSDSAPALVGLPSRHRFCLPGCRCPSPTSWCPRVMPRRVPSSSRPSARSATPAKRVATRSRDRLFLASSAEHLAHWRASRTPRPDPGVWAV
jgi:hypothetical protein